MNELPSHQSRIDSPKVFKTNEFLGLLLGPVTQRWKWSEDAIAQWVTTGTGLRKDLYVADLASKMTVRGHFNQDNNQGSYFSFQIEKSPESGVFWSTIYIGTITPSGTSLYQRSTVESTKNIYKGTVVGEEMLIPLHAAIASGRFIDGGFPVLGTPHRIANDLDVNLLADALRAQDRHLPILIIASEHGNWAIDTQVIAKRLMGLAHVMAIVDKMTSCLANKVGKDMSIYQGYARLYGRDLLQNKRPIAFTPEQIKGKYGSDMIFEKTIEETLRLSMLPPSITKVNTLQNVIRVIPLKSKEIITTKLEECEKYKNDSPEKIQIDSVMKPLLGQTEDDNNFEKPKIIVPGINKDDFDVLAGELIGRTDKRIDRGLENIRQEFEKLLTQQDEHIGELENKISTLHSVIENLTKEFQNFSMVNKTTEKLQNKNEEKMSIEDIKNVSDLQTAAQMMAEIAEKLFKREKTSVNTVPIVMTEEKEISIEKGGDYSKNVAENIEEILEPKENQEPIKKTVSTTKDTFNHQNLKTYPKTLDPEVVENYLKNWGDAVVLHQKTLETLKKSRYEQPEKVYKVLEALAEIYVPMRREKVQDNQKYATFNERILGLNLRYEAYSKSNSGVYLFPWNGEQRHIEFAIKSRNETIDQRRCLRVYFFWDKDKEQVVIVQAPTHLPTKKFTV